jgi:hypothetical protein
VGLNAQQGSAYVFVLSGESWVQQAKLTAPDGAAGDMFGRSVSGTGDTVVVGAQWDEADGAPTTDNTGSVYVFHRTDGVWGKPTKLTAADTGLLGVSNAISGHTAIAGASFADVGANQDQGAAYVFDLRQQSAATESPRSSIVRLG